MERRRELKRQYKETKKSMGILQIKNLKSGRVFLCYSTELNGKINSQRFQLDTGAHKNLELQKDWNELGEGSFEFKVVEELDHTDNSGTGYVEELKVLKDMIKERLKEQGVEVYS
jgi:hypothetical protein